MDEGEGLKGMILDSAAKDASEPAKRKLIDKIKIRKLIDFRAIIENCYTNPLLLFSIKSTMCFISGVELKSFLIWETA